SSTKKMSVEKGMPNEPTNSRPGSRLMFWKCSNPKRKPANTIAEAMNILKKAQGRGQSVLTAESGGVVAAVPVMKRLSISSSERLRQIWENIPLGAWSSTASIPATELISPTILCTTPSCPPGDLGAVPELGAAAGRGGGADA